jgi:hypothetical protein
MRFTTRKKTTGKRRAVLAKRRVLIIMGDDVFTAGDGFAVTFCHFIRDVTYFRMSAPPAFTGVAPVDQ